MTDKTYPNLIHIVPIEYFHLKVTHIKPCIIYLFAFHIDSSALKEIERAPHSKLIYQIGECTNPDP